MLPDTTKITESPADINLPVMLNVINGRLEALLSKDHTIGHAWLMKIDTLENLQLAFKNKILPLLQEFFYNDYAKIGLVLGKSFVESKTAGKQFAKFDDELASDYADKIIYSLKDPSDWTLDSFKSIYS
jgi:5-methylcytosine-specific restriction protein B